MFQVCTVQLVQTAQMSKLTICQPHPITPAEAFGLWTMRRCCGNVATVGCLRRRWSFRFPWCLSLFSTSRIYHHQFFFKHIWGEIHIFWGMRCPDVSQNTGQFRAYQATRIRRQGFAHRRPLSNFAARRRGSWMIVHFGWVRFGDFLKWWYPTTMGFPTKNDHFGVFWGYHHLRKHPFFWTLGFGIEIREAFDYLQTRCQLSVIRYASLLVTAQVPCTVFVQHSHVKLATATCGSDSLQARKEARSHARRQDINFHRFRAWLFACSWGRRHSSMSSNQQGGISDGFRATTGVSQVISSESMSGGRFLGLRHCCRKMPKPIHLVPWYGQVARASSDLIQEDLRIGNSKVANCCKNFQYWCFSSNEPSNVGWLLLPWECYGQLHCFMLFVS